MSAEPALIDTNVLVYALFAGNPEHAASLALLESTQLWIDAAFPLSYNPTLWLLLPRSSVRSTK